MTSIYTLYDKLAAIAADEFEDIIAQAQILRLPSGEPTKLRLSVIDGSLIDIWLSSSGRYSYHWDRRELGLGIYRHDNAPHERWRYVKTFPKHFHELAEENVRESYIDDRPEIAIRDFLGFVRQKLLRGEENP